MKIFVSGGCKNGKSYYAQRLAKMQQNNNALYYVATMAAVDYEDDQRIARHLAEREGWGFITIEQSQDIDNILDKCDHNGSFLLDSLTALLANEMFPPEKEIQATEHIAKNALQKTTYELLRVLNKIPRIVIVSDYMYSDALIYDPLTENYRRTLAELDKLAAKHCDVVLEVSYSQVVVHKGASLFHETYKELC